MSERQKDQLILVLAVLCIVLAVALGKREVGGFSVSKPPARYICDAPYDLIIQSPAMTRLSCAFRGSPGPACATIGVDPITGRGTIWMPDETIGWTKYERREVFDHEHGHVCGYPKDHSR